MRISAAMCKTLFRDELHREKKRTLDRYRVLAPDRFRRLGAEHGQRFVDHVHEEGYHRLALRSRADINYFGFVMLLTGSWFHDDPLFASMSAPLARGEDPDLRIGALYHEFQRFRRCCWGDDLSRLVRALRAAADMLDRIANQDRLSDLPHKGLVPILRSIHPERLDHAGRSAIEKFVDFRAFAATQAGFVDGEAHLAFAILGMMFGSRFEVDPLYPWTSAILADSTATPATRLRSLMELSIAELRAGADELES